MSVKYASVFVLLINCIITLSKWLWNHKPHAIGSAANFEDQTRPKFNNSVVWIFNSLKHISEKKNKLGHEFLQKHFVLTFNSSFVLYIFAGFQGFRKFATSSAEIACLK